MATNTSEKEDKFKVMFDMAVALISTDKKPFSPEKLDKKLSSAVSLMLDQNIPDLPVKDILEEHAYEVQEDAGFSKKLHCRSCNQSKVESGEINVLLSLSFPKKLWKIVESDEFKSIGWNDHGDCVIIDELCFQREILDRRGILRIFDTDSMKSFIRQLNLYGFSKIRKNITLPHFQAEKNRTRTRILLYHNPYFRRGCPFLIQRMKRRVGIKSNEQPNPISPNLKRRKPAAPKKYISFQDSVQPNDLQTPCLQETMHKNLQNNSINAGNGKMNHSYPVSTPWPLENGTLNSIQNGIYNQQRNLSMDINATSSICPYFPLTSETGLESSMGLHRLPSTYQDFVFMNAQFTTLMSFWNPWLSMLMAATSSIPLTETLNQQFTFPGQPCSLCNCYGNTEPSASCDSANSNSAELL
ncbi:heat shock transcription factor, Y-linked-like [Mauremys mutica]|uniref:heat shock transcription factor, Y-linked-like n=1 Tax=Mauremys mutica TaxID=74926 RepID=UPI001D16F783|nr:heat shock transcription factor, Y-linked-like [Mauremys mutica]